MEKSFYHRFLLLLSLIAGTALRAQTLSLQMCYEEAVKNYPLIRQQGLLDKSRDLNLQNASKMYLPQLSVNALAGYVFGGLPSLAPPGTGAEEKSDIQFIGLAQLNQVIWDGGATRSNKALIRATAETEKAQLEVSLYTLRERVTQVYMGILLLEEQQKQLLEQEDLLSRNLKRIQLLRSNGLALSNEEDELQVELLRLGQKKTELLYSRRAYLNMLAYFLQRELGDNTVLESPELSIKGNSEIKRPELVLFDRQKALNENRSDADKVSLMPRLGLMGAGVAFAPAINLGMSEMKSLAILGLSFSWNTSGIYRNNNNSELNKLNSQKIDLQREQFLYNTALQLTQLKAEEVKKEKILQQDESIITLRQRISKAYQIRYENGTCSLSELLAAGDREAEARAALALHKMEWLISKINQAITSGN